MKSKHHNWYTVEILPPQSSHFEDKRPPLYEFIKLFRRQSLKDAREIAQDMCSDTKQKARVFIFTWSTGKNAIARYTEVQS
jgi:hypothetical protein